MLTLEWLRVEHGPAVLAFEVQNREYFAQSISDRGDEFFDRFREDLDRLLADQLAARSAFFVLVERDGAVVGRFNLYDLDHGCATVGYRLARRIAGRGIATATLRELCSVAARLGVRTLVAATSEQNAASRQVLIKAGFVEDGPADPCELGGKRGSRFRRDLSQSVDAEA